MERKCCNIEVTETDEGYLLKITGENVKEQVRRCLERCCKGDEPSSKKEGCC